MTLSELTGKLQNLCHDGHSLDEVLIDLDGCNETYAEIEVKRVKHLKNEKSIVALVAKRGGKYEM